MSFTSFSKVSEGIKSIPDMSAVMSDINQTEKKLEEDSKIEAEEGSCTQSFLEENEGTGQPGDWADIVTESVERGDWEYEAPPGIDPFFPISIRGMDQLEAESLESTVINLVDWINGNLKTNLYYQRGIQSVYVRIDQEAKSAVQYWENPGPSHQRFTPTSPSVPPIPARKDKKPPAAPAAPVGTVKETQIESYIRKGIRFTKRNGSGTVKLTMETPGLSAIDYSVYAHLPAKEALFKILKKANLLKALAVRVKIDDPIWPAE
ncbi:phosphoprotein [Aruac virus]|uniref:Phosphoprotein n=1 Tax=Aruac virus TaxID=1272961 RepID=A0A0D3R109_9RHAB|nr:phosphoprotein [Aruac virus]AJR28313.1 phosphoprotein [Aruac virus]